MIYKMTHKGTRGCVYLLFEAGQLKTMHYEFLDMKFKMESFFKANIPLKESECTAIPEPLKCVQIPAKTAREKVLSFCHFYKHNNPHNIKKAVYTAQQKDFNNLQKYVVTDSYLRTYFQQKDFPFTASKSITDYIRLYNEVRRIATNGPDKETRFPDEYDASFEKRLSGDELSKYWQHLTKLGYTRDKIGTTTRWRKKDLFQ